MINWKLVTPANILIIGAIAVAVHFFAAPLLDTLDGSMASSSDDDAA